MTSALLMTKILDLPLVKTKTRTESPTHSRLRTVLEQSTIDIDAFISGPIQPNITHPKYDIQVDNNPPFGDSQNHANPAKSLHPKYFANPTLILFPGRSEVREVFTRESIEGYEAAERIQAVGEEVGKNKVKKILTKEGGKKPFSDGKDRRVQQ
ncbi:hypothetical protein AVEN_40847-1 [Araneus ventricosus]|uniref:Uncharacterized protein n=1 Tax=Araneus ventricosus TaxID=182803 RepID=A0A4Y2J3E6_ARAVE|nr:hypothetical protein AVEN_40847-1 [Araneus ventricosus]